MASPRSAVTQCEELQTPVSNPVRPPQIMGKFFHSLSCTNEFLAIDSGGYVCRNNLRASIAAWLDNFQVSRGVRLKRTGME